MTTPDAVWSALAHPARRRIVDRLRDGPALTGELTALAATPADGHGSRFAAQRHLKVLRAAGLVLTEESGRERRNHLNGVALYAATIGWLDPPSQTAAGSLHALKAQVENRSVSTQPTISAEEAPMTSSPDTATFRQFSIHQQVHIRAEQAQVWEAVTGDVSAWWGAPYLLLEPPGTRITLDPTLGATVVERAGDEERSWGTVTGVAPGRMVAWTGSQGTGPLGWGTCEIRLTTDGDATRVDLTHDAFGGFGERTTGSYEYGWHDLLERLRIHLEDGVDLGVAGANHEPDGFVHP